MQDRLTIIDIARLCNVGKSTVSRVLNNESGVSQKTREKIEAVIREQQFVPSKSARAMRIQSDKLVAIIISRLASPSENAAVSSMLPLLYQQGYDSIIMESQFDPLSVEEHLHQLKLRHADGVILFGFSGMPEKALLPWQHNLVLFSRKLDNFSSVSYDDKGAIRLLMEAFYQQGHRHISFLGVHNQDSTTGLLRHQAYLDCCAELAISPHSIQGELSYQSGYKNVASVIKVDTTALLCATDTLALGANKYLQQQEIDIQVGSIGNTPLLKFLFPNTLSVDFGYAEAGKQAATQLINQISQQQPIQQIIIPSKLS
nr:trehalose operon repressor TreR [uncultured Moellerella sp.]